MSFSQLRPTQLCFARLTPPATRFSWRSTALGRRYMSQDIGRDFMTGEASSRLTITKTTSPKELPPSKSLLFGRTFSDHMLRIPWTEATGWGAPSIAPFSDINLSPGATVLHYAQSLFEGMKAYRHEDGTVTMFRPDMNMKRMNSSAQRLALPTFNGDALIECMKELISLDRNWIPKEPGHSLYIRPTLIGTNGTLGVAPPNEALLFVITSPAGPYYPQGFKPVPLHGTTEYIRAAPGGTGAYKLSANYAPGVVAQKSAAKQGYAQNLWLHGPEHWLTEVGTMNLFVVIKDRDGVTELITPPLDGMILPGVTRDSVLTLARNHASGAKRLQGLPDAIKISERPINMAEIILSSKEGRLVELFGTGTAAVVTPVERIGYNGGDVMIPTGEDGMGPVSKPLWTELVGIQTGAIKSDWNYVVAK
ncbi:branched-chain amino acid aminotransferase II [Rhizopogon vinicolor AM-OR11-026]|uniref:Branched-chain-amino-acid aminotransferase n=1 Tax=Rhizopogon vinicolor AM-OR11-026 TaxID=1314800 RepID=A0A1B7MMA7_9AGAM|nr:branched-chain amino acid aminotransferase II [Rhizopogon vinicolor AM-OR11-026]